MIGLIINKNIIIYLFSFELSDRYLLIIDNNTPNIIPDTIKIIMDGIILNFVSVYILTSLVNITFITIKNSRKIIDITFFIFSINHYPSILNFKIYKYLLL